ncbi:MAG: cyclic pyranopterin monophosphate synthase MoaC [Planctomycetaceae bacterium]|nr:cyclic pyranopterin monophosphate synthase MoaC [Planctomycetaceae bacterium]
MTHDTPLTHFDDAGNAVMVDVSAKDQTVRTAVAGGEIRVGPAIFAAIREGTAAKGDVLGVARLAGIMAVKKTVDLIPLCHPLAVSKCAVDFDLDESAHAVRVRCMVKVTGRTGVEMEALTGATVALLTIYDMTKAMGKTMEIGAIRLLEKSGGKSGDYRAGETA